MELSDEESSDDSENSDEGDEESGRARRELLWTRLVELFEMRVANDMEYQSQRRIELRRERAVFLFVCISIISITIFLFICF